ncbi:MAG: hypothetical protein ACLP6G_16025 [Terriglobales bacterium]
MRFKLTLVAIAAFSLICPASAVSQTSPEPKPAIVANAVPAAPSASDIAAAKASHKVWVNLDTGIYHKGGRWYGKTKTGKFMTADDAKKAGYKPAKRD